jgi:hypothetical protein
MKRMVWIECFALMLLAVAPLPTAHAQPAAEITVLREIVVEVESGRGIILAPYGANALGGLAVVDRDRVGTIAVWLVLNGWVDPDSVSVWTRQQLAASNAVLEILKRQLRELEAQQPAAGTPTARASGATPGAAGVTPTPPPPTDWRLVKETLRGTYNIPCPAYLPGGGNLAPSDDGMRPLAGNFSLTLVGDGTVRVTFDFHGEPIETLGTIRNDMEIGVAEGGGATPDNRGIIDIAFDEAIVQGGEYKWMLRLGRFSNRVVVEPRSTLEFVNRRPADESPPACQPGTMRFAD